MVRKIRKLTVLFLLLIVTLPNVLALSGELTVENQLKYTGTSSDPSTFYQDAVGGSFGNPDVGIQLCDVGQRYVGGFYAINVLSNWYYSLVTYSSSTNALAFTTNDVGGGCYEASPGFVTVSPSALSTPNPNVYRAALPGNLYIGYAGSSNPGTISDFTYTNGGGQLLGDYTVGRHFSEATREIDVSLPQITFTGTSGSFSKSASDANFGINSERQLVLGVCDDSYGESCSAGGLLSSPAFPVSLSTGLTAGQVNDQQTHTKYVVLNGLGKQICIGANLQADVTGISLNPIYYSQTLDYNVSLSNPRDTPYELAGGNVPISTNFDLTVTIYEQGNTSNIVHTEVVPVIENFLVDEIIVESLQWPAYAHSGTYVIKAEVDSNNDIVECDEGDNIDNDATFELLAITLPEIYIDDVETDEFDIPSTPYKMGFYMKNSDDETLNNATVFLTETNGLSIAAPTQIYNMTTASGGVISKSGIVSKTQAEFVTDLYGKANLTFIPTYNRYYSDQFDFDLEDYVGEYSLTLSGSESDGDLFKFVIDEILYSEYPLTLNNLTYNGTYEDKTIYHETFVAQALDFAYHVYTNFLDAIIS